MLIGPSLFTTRRSLDWVKRWIGVRSAPTKVYLSSTFVTALREKRLAPMLIPGWETWSDRRPGPSKETVAELVRAWLKDGLISLYTPPKERVEGLSFEDFQKKLPPGRPRQRLTLQILYEAFQYLEARTLLLSQHWWPFDALVEAGCVAIQWPQRDLPAPVLSALRRWGIKGSVTYAALGIGGRGSYTILPELSVGPVEVPGGIFLGIVLARAL